MNNLIEIPPKQTPSRDINNRLGDVQVSVNIDVLQILLLLVTTSSLVLTYLSKIRLDKTVVSDVLTRLKPSDFRKDKEIESLMNRMLGLTNASRVVVALFTNGTKAHNFPFRYFSIFWEVTSEGIATTKYDYQHVALAKIRDDLEFCMEKPDEFRYVNAKQPETREQCKAYMAHSGIHSLFTRLIGNTKDGFVGIMNIHFESDIRLSDNELNNLDKLFLVLENKLTD
jgi:hypothetical protein